MEYIIGIIIGYIICLFGLAASDKDTDRLSGEIRILDLRLSSIGADVQKLLDAQKRSDNDRD